MSDKKLVSDSTVNYLVNRIKNDYIPFEDIVDLQEKVINPPTNTCESVEVNPDTNYEGFSTVTVNELNPEQITVTSSNASQVINNKYISQVTVEPIIYEDKTVTLSQDSNEILPDTDEAMNSVTINPRTIVAQDKTTMTCAITKTVTPDENYNIMSKLTVNPYNKLPDILAGNLFDITDDDLVLNPTYIQNFYIPAYLASNIEHINILNNYEFNTGSSERKLRVYLKTFYADQNTSQNQISPTCIANYSNLKTINIPYGKLTSIPAFAFKDNQYLEDITNIGDTNIAVGKYAFYNNSKIVSVPALTSVGDYAFYHCSHLENVQFYISEEAISGYHTIYKIGKHAFEGCLGVTSILLPNGYQSAAGSWSNDYTTIDESAFENCINLTSIGFVTKNDYSVIIRKNAFKGCTSLTTVKIPDMLDIHRIGESSFEGCTSLIDVTSTTNNHIFLGEKTFKNCISLFQGSFASTFRVWAICGSNAFEGIPITELECPTLRVHQDSRTNCDLFGGMPNLEKLTVGNVSSGTLSKQDNNSKVLVIPSTVKHFVVKYRNAESGGMQVFSQDDTTSTNSTLTKVEYINSLGTTDCFRGCLALNDVTLCEGLTSIIRKGFQGCTGLTSINLPSTLTTIGELAFYGCTGLTSINLDNVTTLGNSAFYNCTGLTSINLDNVTTIGNNTFEGCIGLTSINLDNVTTIGNNTFEGCVNLNVNLSNLNNLEQIGQQAFKNCAALTNFTFPSALTTIGNGAFYNCTGLTSIEIPSSVTTMGGAEFINCTNLTTATISCNVSALIDTFVGCNKLTNVTFTNSSNLRTLNGTFTGCHKLTTIDIPSGVTTIGGYTFNGCSSLTSVDFPSSVITIGTSAFQGCTSLTNIDLSNTSITSIDTWGFQGCTNLTTVTLPNTLTELLGNTFWNCKSLTSITLPDAVISLGIGSNGFNYGWDFYSCTSLQTVSLGPNITQFGNNPFTNCPSLTTITVRGNSSCATAQALQALGPSAYNNATIVYTES